jgi:hypothetical protein
MGVAATKRHSTNFVPMVPHIDTLKDEDSKELEQSSTSKLPFG